MPTDPDRLAADLRERVDGEVRFDAGSRAAYATDASNFHPNIARAAVQVTTGKKILARTVRADALELVPADLDVRRLARQTVTLAELLTTTEPDEEK